MNEIEYELRVDDYVNWSLFSNFSSSAWKKTIIYMFIAGNVALLCTVFYPVVRGYSALNLPLFVVAFIGVNFFIFGLGLIQKWQSKLYIKSFIESDDTKIMVGKHLIGLNEDSVYTKSKYIESKYSFDILKNAIETDQYFFIDIGSRQAFLLPKKSIISGDLEAFLEQLRKKVPGFEINNIKQKGVKFSWLEIVKILVGLILLCLALESCESKRQEVMVADQENYDCLPQNIKEEKSRSIDADLEKELLKQAEDEFLKTYGNRVLKQKPYIIESKTDFWKVSGSLNCSKNDICLGGVAEIKIDKESRDVISVTHGK